MAANRYTAESGLLAVMVMGVALANQRLCPVRHIAEFNEHLRTLIISVLFILLAARLTVPEIESIGWRECAFLLTLIAIVRPAAVWISSLDSQLTASERLFLSAMAPRGIVAAAVASIFSTRLAAAGYPGAERLTTVVFFVIIGTVAVYGLTAFPLARKLGLAQPHPQGVLFVGANRWVRLVAHALEQAGFRAVVVDSNWAHVSAARLEGLGAHYGSILSRQVLDEIDLYGLGRLLAVTPNDEANSLAAVHFADVFGRREVYQLPREGAEESPRAAIFPAHLQGRRLFSSQATFEELQSRAAQGWTPKRTTLSETFTYDDFLAQYGEETIPLFLITEEEKLRVAEAGERFKPKAGQSVVCLVKPE